MVSDTLPVHVLDVINTVSVNNKGEGGKPPGSVGKYLGWAVFCKEKNDYLRNQIGNQRVVSRHWNF